MRFAPIDALPIGRLLGYVCNTCLHLTLPSAFSLVSTFLTGLHLSHVCTLSSWAIALSAPLWIPVTFWLAAFASWDILFPLEDSTAVALGLPNSEGRIRTLSEFPRSARGEDMIALGLLFTPGARCSQLIFRRYQLSCAPIFSYQPFRELNITKPHQGFICIILSNLALALSPGLAPGLLDT